MSEHILCAIVLLETTYSIMRSLTSLQLQQPLSSWHKIGCFTLPRALKKEGATVESFVVEDLTDADGLLEEHKDEVIAAIEAGSAAKKKSPVKKESGNTPFGIIKRNFEAIQNADDEDRPAKRSKLNDVEQQQVDLYEEYKSHNADELKDYMRYVTFRRTGSINEILYHSFSLHTHSWNRQMVGGKKDLLVLRCIDGKMNGRLGRCPMCHRGKLAMRDDLPQDMCSCNGYYDDDMQARVPCSYKMAVAKAPRVKPWFTEAPTEEEEKELDDLDEQAKSDQNAVSSGNQGAVDDLLAKAKKVDWKTGSKDDIKASSLAMLEIAEGGGVELPSGSEKKAVGKIVVMNKSSTATEVMQLIIDEYGFANDKAAANQAMDDAASELCTVAANAKFYSMMDEFAKLLRKAGEFMKANSFLKAAQAIASLDFEVTEDNALKLGKSGKLKVPGIGKSTAEKLHELITTGSVEKLEQLRASAGA